MRDHRICLAQNFIVRPRLAASLVAQSSIGIDDVVYEIGPGKGALTRELAGRARRVIAIEKDYHLYSGLKEQFKHQGKLILLRADFLGFTIRTTKYKVFANLPFNLTAAIVRKLVWNPNPPSEAYLIMQKEAAEKFSGVPRATRFSIFMWPWFKAWITRRFRRIDFTPAPAVDVVMLHIERRAPPLLPPAEIRLYKRFVACGFNAWRKNVKLNYKCIFSHEQWKRLSRDLGFNLHCRPSELSGHQWVGLYKFYKDHADPGVKSPRYKLRDC